VILDQLVGLEDVAPDLAAEVRLLSNATLAGELVLALLLLHLGQTRLEDPQRRLLVRSLRALVLHRDDDAARNVCDPNGRVGLVDMLPAGAACAVGVDPEVGLVDLAVWVWGRERADAHLRKGGMPGVGLVEGRQANEPVHAALGLENAVGVLSLDRKRRRFQARLFSGAR